MKRVLTGTCTECGAEFSYVHHGRGGNKTCSMPCRQKLQRKSSTGRDTAPCSPEMAARIVHLLEVDPHCIQVARP